MREFVRSMVRAECAAESVRVAEDSAEKGYPPLLQEKREGAGGEKNDVVKCLRIWLAIASFRSPSCTVFAQWNSFRDQEARKIFPSRLCLDHRDVFFLRRCGVK